MKKYNILILVLAYAVTLVAMNEEQLILTPQFVQPSSYQLSKLRQRFNTLVATNPTEVCAIDNSITLLEELPIHVRPGVCFNYAIVTTLKRYGIEKQFHINGCQDWEIILPFFETVSNYQKGDLVIYFTQEGNKQTIQHFGLLSIDAMLIESKWEDIMRVESKWSDIKGLFGHNMFHVPQAWGSLVTVMRLKEEYHTPGAGQDQLIKYLMDWEALPAMRERLLSLASKLIGYVQNGNLRKIIDLLEQHPTISIDTVDNDRRTLLMLAVEKNNIRLVRLLLCYGARKDMKDGMGHTVFHLAQLGNNSTIIELLAQPFVPTYFK